jgi:hypothetical protein
MEREELVARSPVRVFEKAINGGLKAGEIGVITSEAGVGKTSILVQIAIDSLLQNKKIIHVSFTQDHDYVFTWYKDIFNEFIRKKNVENDKELRETLNQGRVFLNFNQKGVNNDTIRASLKAIIVEGGFHIESVIIDGFDFTIAKRERITALRDFSKELGFSLWYSCSAPQSACDKNNIPLVLKDFEDCIDVVIGLEPKSDHVSLYVAKNHGAYLDKFEPLRLDPKTLLML